MKKSFSLLFLAVLLLGCLSACGKKSVHEESGKLQIVATIFPEYDWVNQILGGEKDHAEVTMLLNNGVDLHSFQPTPEDILKLSTCDLFLYVGGESDDWVEDALSEASNPKMIVINLLQVLGDQVKEEEAVEGMEKEKEENEGETEYDEHVWLSLKNASILCDAIAEGLGKADPANKKEYAKNLAAYQKQLSELDQKYQEAVEQGEKKTILFGDRFPFRYLVDDYGLSYYAAFAGCSAETEASFETIVFLAGKVDELGLSTIFTIEGEEHKIAETIRENTKKKDQNIEVLNSMQAVTSKDVEAGTRYLDIMASNLEILKNSLGKL